VRKGRGAAAADDSSSSSNGMSAKDAYDTPVRLTTQKVSRCIWNCKLEFTYDNEYEWRIAAIQVSSAKDPRTQLVRFYVDGPVDPAQADIRWNDKSYRLHFFEIYVSALHAFEGQDANRHAVEVHLCHKKLSEQDNDWVVVSVMVDPSYTYNLSQDFFKRLLGKLAAPLYEEDGGGGGPDAVFDRSSSLSLQQSLWSGAGGDATMCSTQAGAAAPFAGGSRFRCAEVAVEGAGRARWTPYQLLPFDKAYLMYPGKCPYTSRLDISYGPAAQRDDERVTFVVMTTSVSIHYDELAVLKRLYGSSIDNGYCNYMRYRLASITSTDIRYNSGGNTLANNASNMARDGKYMVKCERAGQSQIGGKPTFGRAVRGVATPKDSEVATRGVLAFHQGSASALPTIMLAVFFSVLMVVVMGLPALHVRHWQNVLMVFACACMVAMLVISTYVSALNVVMIVLGPLFIVAILLVNFVGKFVMRHDDAIRGADIICMITAVVAAALLAVFAITCVVGSPLQFNYDEGSTVRYYCIMHKDKPLKESVEDFHFVTDLLETTPLSEMRFFVGTKAVVDVMFVAPMYYRQMAQHVHASSEQVAVRSVAVTEGKGASYTPVNGPYEIVPSDLSLSPKQLYKVCKDYDANMKANHSDPLTSFAKALQKANGDVTVADAIVTIETKLPTLGRYLQYNNQFELT
jgi:hypothetical protein